MSTPPISSYSVAGLTLRGGLGWLLNRLGMAVDNLTSVELVTADGDVRNLLARSAFFKELFADVVGVLVDAFERVPSPMWGIVIEDFHGVVTCIGPTATG